MRGYLIASLCALSFVAGCQSDKKEAKKDSMSINDSVECTEAKPAVAKTAAVPAAPAAPAQPVAKYGAASKLTDAEAMTVERVLSDPTPFDKHYVRLTGK